MRVRNQTLGHRLRPLGLLPAVLRAGQPRLPLHLAPVPHATATQVRQRQLPELPGLRAHQHGRLVGHGCGTSDSQSGEQCRQTANEADQRDQREDTEVDQRLPTAISHLATHDKYDDDDDDHDHHHDQHDPVPTPATIDARHDVAIVEVADRSRLQSTIELRRAVDDASVAPEKNSSTLVERFTCQIFLSPSHLRDTRACAGMNVRWMTRRRAVARRSTP